MRIKPTLVFVALLSLILLLLPVVFPFSGNTNNTVAALGRFHILVLHFPIALLLIVPVLELLGRFSSLKYLQETSLVILLLGFIFGFKACILGYLLAAGEAISGTLLSQHMWTAIISTVLTGLTVIIKIIGAAHPSTGTGSAYALALAATLAALTIGSHHGASMVHGEDYLYAKLPPALQSVFTGEAFEEKLITPESSAYEAVIQPIFEQHCYVCHSEAKDQGGFRMDDFELLLSGGDGGMPGIEPGNLEDSEVHYRITLKPSAKAFMPPDGRTPLSADEVALITWWIENGGSATTPINGLPNPPQVLDTLLSPPDA